MSWSARQYSRFEEERNRPIMDLLGRLPETGIDRVMDIGCGPGNSTELLKRRYPQAAVHGLDSSPDMVAAARSRLPDVAFQQADISAWAPDSSFDLIFANAILQWLPDHEAVFARLLANLTAGGRLAVQMPDNLDEPAHVVMREVAARPRWAGVFDDVGGLRAPRRPASWYMQQFAGQTSDLDIWRTVYYHRLVEGVDGLVEWFKGAALRPYLDRVSASDGRAFLADYRDAIAGSYPMLADGSLLLPYPRLFLVLTVRTA